MSELFFKNFEVLADAPNGIQKLRELILQLAVQGKLVTQNPDDEPASILLKKIKAEKEKLSKEGKLQRQNPLPPIDPDELPYNLQEGWEWAQIGTIATVKGGKRVPKGYSLSSSPTEHIYIRVTDMKNATILDDDLRYITDEVYSLIKNYTISKDDIYITIAGTIGLVGSVPPLFDGMNLTENAAKLTLGGGYKEYSVVALRSDIVQGQFSERTNQLAQPKLALKRIAISLIPVPPLPEQKRIVAKVDQLMALCDDLEGQQKKKHEVRIHLNDSALDKLVNAHNPGKVSHHWKRISDNFDLLYDHPETVGKLRQAILQLAVMGGLVPQDPNDETASEVVKRIAAEKERLIAEGKTRKQTPLPPIDPREIPCAVPTGWEWVRVEQVSQAIEYGTSHRASMGGKGVPILRMNNVGKGEVKLDDVKYVPAEIDDLPRLFLDKGDILFNRTNSYELVGKAGIFTGESHKFTFASYLVRVKLVRPHIVPQYVNICLNARYFRVSQIEPAVTQQCGQANFSGGKLRKSYHYPHSTSKIASWPRLTS